MMKIGYLILINDNIGGEVMDYKEQLNTIVDYFKANEKKEDDFKIGIEFEHFVIYKDSLKTVSYYGEKGVGESLADLEKKGWKASYEGEYILGLEKGNKVVTLEPGSQLELSVKAQKDLGIIAREYREFVEEIKPILESKGQTLISVGYHPATKIDEITLLPKNRYDFMFNYFKTKGTHAHNMMKGTAALQVSLDYKDEEDYEKKFKLANAIGPVFYASIDNGYFFEGEPFDGYGLRTLIWNNCDNDRSGVVPGALDGPFGYKDYGNYILNAPPIFRMTKGEAVSTGDKKIKDVFDPNKDSQEEMEHLLTMVFPDVRTKKFVEIRMMDSVPYPLNIGVAAVLKGIFYNEDNLNKLYDIYKDVREEDIRIAKGSIIKEGINASYMSRTILDRMKEIIEISKSGLNEEELTYLKDLEDMINKGYSPRDITASKIGNGKAEALAWAMI